MEEVFLLKECLSKLEDTLKARVNSSQLKVGQSYTGDVIKTILNECGFNIERSATLQALIQVRNIGKIEVLTIMVEYFFIASA